MRLISSGREGLWSLDSATALSPAVAYRYLSLLIWGVWSLDSATALSPVTHQRRAEG